MTVLVDLAPVEVALFSKVKADAPLVVLMPGGIWADPAPAGQAPPYLLVTLLASPRRRTFAKGTDRPVYRFRSVCSGPSAKPARDLADRLCRVLDHSTLTVSGYAILLVERVNRLSYSDVVDGTTWRYDVSDYQLEVESS